MSKDFKVYKNDDAFDSTTVEDDTVGEEIEPETLDHLSADFDWNDEKDLDKLHELDGWG